MARNSRYWMGLHTWFIDDSGSIEATGADAGHPVPAAERRRRMGPNAIWESADYHMRYMATTAADSFDGDCSANTAVYCHAGASDRVGVSPVSHTSSALDVLNTGTNVPFAVTAGTLTASAAVNKRVRWTSGAASGAHAWGTLAVTSTKLRTTEFLIPVASFTAAPFAAPNNTVASPSNGDTFVVEDLRALTRLHIGLRSAPSSNSFRVVLDSISTTLSGARDCIVYSDGSSIGTVQGEILSHSIHGCQINSLLDNGRKAITGGYASTNLNLAANAASAVSNIDHFTIQGDRFIILGAASAGTNTEGWRIQQVGMFDMLSPLGTGIYIASPCRLASFVLYGSGNTAQPFVLNIQGTLISNGTITATMASTIAAAFGIITGAGANIRYSIPAYDTASGIWTEPRLMSFANLGLSVAQGGFGNFLQDPLTGAKGTS